MVPLVLAVDDDRSSQILMRAHLLDEHFCDDCVGVSNGQEALDYLESLPNSQFPDLIFLDIHMPEMDGWQLVDAITPLVKARNKYPTIVLLSATNTAEDMQKAAQHPMVLDITTKPINNAFLHYLKSIPNLRHYFENSEASTG